MRNVEIDHRWQADFTWKNEPGPGRRDVTDKTIHGAASVIEIHTTAQETLLTRCHAALAAHARISRNALRERPSRFPINDCFTGIRLQHYKFRMIGCSRRSRAPMCRCM